MAYSRYSGRGVFHNSDRGYQKSLFDNRDVKRILQYRTARFYYPTFEERGSMNLQVHVWTAIDKLYNLADSFYGSPELWWLIAWFNQKPTEAHFEVGDTIYIPTDVNEILASFAQQNNRAV